MLCPECYHPLENEWSEYPEDGKRVTRLHCDGCHTDYEQITLFNKMGLVTSDRLILAEEQPTCCGGIPLISGKCPICGDKL